MPILYCVIARKNLVLVKHAAVAGNFEEVTQNILKRELQEYSKVTYSHYRFLFHNVLENGISFMCVTDDVSTSYLEQTEPFLSTYWKDLSIYRAANQFKPIIKKYKSEVGVPLNSLHQSN